MILRNISALAIVLVLCGAGLGQTKSFTPVDGANLKAKIDNAIIAGKANAPGGRFWVGYQFEVRPGVAIDFEIVDSTGGVFMAMDGTSMMFDARQAAMTALAMSRSAATLPLLQNLFETMTSHDLKQRALRGIARNDNSDGAAAYLIRIAETEKDFELRKNAIANLGKIAGQKSLGALTSTVDGDAETELQKQAVIAIGRRAKDESIPILIRTARNHPKMAVRKVAVQVLGQTGDERAVAFFRELLSKD